MDENGLAILCGHFGEVIKCAIMRDKKGISRCIAMVAFATSEQASHAVLALHNCCVDAKGEICERSVLRADCYGEPETENHNEASTDDSRSVLTVVYALKDPLTEEEIQARSARVRALKDQNKQMNRANQALHQETRLQRLQALSSLGYKSMTSLIGL